MRPKSKPVGLIIFVILILLIIVIGGAIAAIYLVTTSGSTGTTTKPPTDSAAEEETAEEETTTAEEETTAAEETAEEEEIPDKSGSSSWVVTIPEENIGDPGNILNVGSNIQFSQTYDPRLDFSKSKIAFSNWNNLVYLEGHTTAAVPTEAKISCTMSVNDGPASAADSVAKSTLIGSTNKGMSCIWQTYPTEGSKVCVDMNANINGNNVKVNKYCFKMPAPFKP